MHEISAAEVQRLFPLCSTDDVLAGFYVQDDGRVNPVDATSALARGAKRRGVRLVEGVQVSPRVIIYERGDCAQSPRSAAPSRSYHPLGWRAGDGVIRTTTSRRSQFL